MRSTLEANGWSYIGVCAGCVYNKKHLFRHPLYTAFMFKTTSNSTMFELHMNGNKIKQGNVYGLMDAINYVINYR